jgi:hypothetical protein
MPEAEPDIIRSTELTDHVRTWPLWTVAAAAGIYGTLSRDLDPALIMPAHITSTCFRRPRHGPIDISDIQTFRHSDIRHESGYTDDKHTDV